MKNFIWNKHDRIRRDTVIGKRENGGKGYVDIELRLSASLVKRLTDEPNVINNLVNSYNVLKCNENRFELLSEIKTRNFTLISKLLFFKRNI